MFTHKNIKQNTSSTQTKPSIKRSATILQKQTSLKTPHPEKNRLPRPTHAPPPKNHPPPRAFSVAVVTRLRRLDRPGLGSVVISVPRVRNWLCIVLCNVCVMCAKKSQVAWFPRVRSARWFGVGWISWLEEFKRDSVKKLDALRIGA